MELNEIIQVVEKKAQEVAQEEIVKYSKEFPEITLTPDAKEAVRIRSTSQLTLQLSKFRFHKEQELDEQFNNWFTQNEEEDLRRTCRHCLEDEAKKIRDANNKNLSSLDVYLKKHLGDAHQVD
ncbi:hypothetical protein CIY_18780 [Butyrivibrio fibrisolvens 16/4]|nr:hypothetical protein CIY_18780 [Butyrivibrio fibrisolvens 16/4]